MDMLFFDKTLRCLTTGRETALNEEIVSQAFASTLLELRKHCGLSLIKLSDELEIPNQTLSSYETQKRTPSFIQAIKIASYFGFTVEEFILYGLEESTRDIIEVYESRK